MCSSDLPLSLSSLLPLSPLSSSHSPLSLPPLSPPLSPLSLLCGVLVSNRIFSLQALLLSDSTGALLSPVSPVDVSHRPLCTPAISLLNLDLLDPYLSALTLLFLSTLYLTVSGLPTSLQSFCIYLCYYHFVSANTTSIPYLYQQNLYLYYIYLYLLNLLYLYLLNLYLY